MGALSACRSVWSFCVPTPRYLSIGTSLFLSPSLSLPPFLYLVLPSLSVSVLLSLSVNRSMLACICTDVAESHHRGAKLWTASTCDFVQLAHICHCSTGLLVHIAGVAPEWHTPFVLGSGDHVMIEQDAKRFHFCVQIFTCRFVVPVHPTYKA